MWMDFFYLNKFVYTLLVAMIMNGAYVGAASPADGMGQDFSDNLEQRINSMEGLQSCDGQVLRE
jgi:hypothetical protein